MCLRIKSGPHTAKTEFYTLKLAERTKETHCVSFFHGAIQYYGKTLESDIKKIKFENRIENGLHSLIVSETANTAHTALGDYVFDSFHDERSVILCKVPKGAKYYLGMRSDIVSDKLILVEPLVASSSCPFDLEDNLGCIVDTSEAILKAIDIVKEMELNTNPN